MARFSNKRIDLVVEMRYLGYTTKRAKAVDCISTKPLNTLKNDLGAKTVLLLFSPSNI